MKLKVLCSPPTISRGVHTKTLLIMKFTAILLFVACLQVSAKGYTQITLSEKNVPLQKVFKQIQRQTGYDFLYSVELLQQSGKVSIDVHNVSIEEALKQCLKDKPLAYSIVERTIVIKPVEINSELDIAIEPPPPPLIDLRGRVVNEKGEPVEGVTVTVKGKRNATATNANGEFVLSGVDKDATLVFSGVNVESYELKVDSKTEFGSISLKTKVTQGAEITLVASTGYQTISKERATGSFGTVSKEQLDKPATNIASRIIGTNAGVQALTMDAEGVPFFQIRGLSTLYANQSPLVVVDGFPIQGTFDAVNPNDVESVTILKDAAASSIWGARAANGVIVITTKNAKKGAPLKVEFSAFTRIGGKIDLDYSRPLASSTETVDYEKLAYNKWTPQFNNGAVVNHSQWTWSPGMNALNEQNLGLISMAQRDKTLDSLKTLDNRQQISDQLLENPVTQQYNLSLFSASQRMSNSFSFLFEKNQSNFKKTYNDRFMLNYRTTASLNKWLDLSLNTMVQYNKFTNNGTTLAEISSLSPYEMLMNPDGSLTETTLKYNTPLINRAVPRNLFPYSDWTYNPIQDINSKSLVRQEFNGRIQAGIIVKPMKGLTLESRIQYENFNTTTRNHYNEDNFLVRQTVNHASFWNPGLPTAMTTTPIPNLPKGGFLDQSRNQLIAWNFRNLVSYNKNFGGKHDVNFVGGTEQQSSNLQSFNYARTYGYNDKTLQVGTFPNGPGGTPANGNQNGTGTPTTLTIRNWLNQTITLPYTNSFGYTTDRFFSAFANAAYTYNDKYILSGSFRTDASNLITDDPAYRYNPFWSVGASWQLWKESFMTDINFIDRLSLRVTYGFNGNVDKSTSFMPLISLAATPNVLTNAFTASFSSLGNPTLRWEKTGTTNIGIDYSILKGKLFGKIDYYQRKGKDLIAVIAIPAVNGSTSQRLNNAKMTNSGIEFEVGTKLNITRNIHWSGNLNFSYNNNKITDLFLAQYSASSLTSRSTSSYAVGYNANTLWMYKYMGFNSSNQPTVLGPDNVNFDIQTFIPGDGRTYLANTGTLVAPYTLGFMNNLDMKNFSLSFIITGNFGHIFQRKGFNYPVQWTTRVLPNKFIGEALNGKSNDILTLPLNPNEPRFFFWDRFYDNLSYLAQSASWIRMQEINLTYRLPKSVLEKLGVNNFQVFVQGNDLFVVLANKYGEDPLYLLGSLNPRPKTTFGFKCNF